MDEEWKEYLHNKRTEYSKIGHVECPAFANEKIYFTGVGFSHLISKNRKMREKSEQIKRLTLFPFAPGIIYRSQKIITYFSNINKRGIKISYWTLVGRVNGIDLKVVIRQVNSNPKHFLSIFDEDKP